MKVSRGENRTHNLLLTGQVPCPLGYPGRYFSAQLGIKNAPSPSLQESIQNSPSLKEFTQNFPSLPGSIQTSPSLPDSVQGSPSLTLSLQSSKHNSPTPLQVSVHSLKEAMSPLVEMPSSPGCSKQIPIPIEEDSIESQNRVDNLPSYPMSPEQSYTLSSASVEDFKAQSGPKSPTSPTRGSESCRCSGDYTEPQMSQNSNFSCSSIEESEDNSSKSEENLSRSEDNPNTQGLLRVGGRLKYSYLNENQNFPLLQPKPPRQESLIKNLLTQNADIPEAIDENQEDSSILETTFIIEDEESNKDIGTPKIEISEVSVIDKSEGKYSKEPVVSVEALDKKELCHDDPAHLNVVEADLNRPKEATSGIINVYTEANESSSKEKVVPVEIVDTSTKDYLQSGEKAKLSRWKPIDSLCLEDVKESEDDDENYSSSAYIEWPEILKKEVLRPEALEKAVNLEDFEKAAESRQLSKEHLEESTEQGSCIKAESKPWEDPIESDLAAAESDNPADHSGVAGNELADQAAETAAASNLVLSYSILPQNLVLSRAHSSAMEAWTIVYSQEYQNTLVTVRPRWSLKSSALTALNQSLRRQKRHSRWMIQQAVPEKLARPGPTYLNSWSMIEILQLDKPQLSNSSFLKLEEDKDMQQHITTMMELVDKLRTIGETLKDSHITAILLCSLPKSYSNLITMLESRPDDELTLEFTKNKLLDEHTRRVESSKDESTESKALKSLHGASSQRREKEKKFCSFCHKPNHSKEECWHYQKRNNSNKEYKYENFRRGNVPKYTNQSSVTQEQPTNQRTTKGPNPKALNCTQREASVHNWFVDSGATSHMAYDESFFTELNREQTQNVVVANGNKLQVKGIGQGEIKVITPQGKTDTLLLTKVLYIPELTDNLLSVSAATSNGCKVTFNRDWCTIERDNTALANGILDNGMYRLHLDDNPQTRTFKANVAKQNHCKNKNCLMLWHDRLGHRNIESIKKIRNENLARGLSLNNCSHSTDCVQCIQGKLTETPFPKKTEYRATETLQLVHSDICGPLPTNSLSGKRYFITFTDDYSRYTKTYLLKGKDEAYEKIKDYVISAHTEFGKNIQTIRTDNGREYGNRQVEDFLNQSGIKHQLTVPYSPAQNGVAERKNRSLMEMTRCMLFDSGLPQSLWAEAVTTANYLHNRIPSKATDKTPFELWTNRKPSLKHIKRFGCKAFAYIPKIKRNKLDSKVIEGIFLGYDDRSKGYRILHDTDNITISRSVKFIEKENGFHLASTKTTSPQVLSTDLTSSNHIGNAEESQEPGTQPENLEDSETEDYLQPGTSTGTQVVTQRRSTRPTKGIPPIRNDYMLYKTEAQDIPTPTSYSEVLQLPKIEREKWLQAMNEELNSLEKNNVWELTPLPKDKKIIGCKWTYKQKLNSKGEIERYKARLVAKGFNQKFGRDYEETFAPIVKHSTIRAFLAASVYKGMQVIHLDVKTAFLHGDLDKELYMELPEGLHTKQTNKVCKLKKAIYDIAAPVCILSSRNQNPRNCDWNAAKRIVRYLKTTKELELRISNQKPPTLEAYSDATWASDNTDRKSLSGNLFLLGSNPISWMTGKQGCVSLSSTEAELISAAEASQELLWLLDLLKDLELEQKAPIYFHQDNQSCLKICSSEKVSSRTKHIATKIHHLKDLQKKTVIKMVYCPTGDMKADILTKPLPRPTFEKLRYNLVILTLGFRVIAIDPCLALVIMVDRGRRQLLLGHHMTVRLCAPLQYVWQNTIAKNDQ
ncbi:hypothetical protein LAZ67_1001175 [Cordylochernes scorpioides]|uniref:Integrase catalytic domain-containing protein n=1 Tax=Cordylochernes scorpioides TaxID=51811 RepID=A0ABY6JXT3_9ARAC|nr:hypothetical protein LAZ67_1001175 [Cordylochernes scorpioides]